MTRLYTGWTPTEAHADLDALWTQALTSHEVWATDPAYGASTSNTAAANTLAFQAAANALAATGGVLNVPAGTFNTNQFSLFDNTWLKLSPGAVLRCASSTPGRGVVTNAAGGAGNSNLRVTGGKIQRTVTVGGTFFDLIYFHNCQNVTIEGVIGIAAGTGPLGNKGFTLEGCKNWWVGKNHVKDVPDNAFCATYLAAPHDVPGYGVFEDNISELSSRWVNSAFVVTQDYVQMTGNRVINSTNAFELGEGAIGIEIGNNTGTSTGNIMFLIMASGVSKLRVHHNYSTEDGVAITADNTAASDLVFANNMFPFGGINLKGGTSGMDDVTVIGNRINRYTQQSVSRANVLDNISKDAIGVAFNFVSTSDRAVIRGNIARDSVGDGFFLGSHCATYGVFEGNRAYNSGGWGFDVDQPQNWDYIDNEGAGNASGLLTVTNATLQGPTPFLKVRYADTGAPTMYGNPGSEYTRVDGDDVTKPLRYVKSSANTVNSGWQPIGTTGHAGDLVSAVALTLPAGGSARLTGATAITSIVAGYAGRKFDFTSDGGGHVLTDGSNLKLAGNWTPGDSDSLSVFYDGTNWIEKSRSNN